MKSKIVGFFVIIVASLAIGASNAALAEPNDDPSRIQAVLEEFGPGPISDAQWESLTAEEQKAAIEFLTVVELEVGKPGPAEVLTGEFLAATCGWIEYPVKGNNSFGVALWTYTQRIDWCWDGTWVTSYAYRSRWGTTHYPGWQFNGHIDGSTAGGVGYTQYYAFTQGEFALCGPVIGCVQHAYPYIHLWGYGNGTG